VPPAHECVDVAPVTGSGAGVGLLGEQHQRYPALVEVQLVATVRVVADEFVVWLDRGQAELIGVSSSSHKTSIF
jgi:hypothetical protein